MPVNTIIFPSGDGTGDFTAHGGPSTKWETVNSGIATPFDATYLHRDNDEPYGSQFLGLEDLPSYFNTVASVSATVRLRKAYLHDEQDITLQCFEADGTTLLTYSSSKNLDGISHSNYDDYQFDFALSGIGESNSEDKHHGICVWEDALLKITTGAGSNDGAIEISEIQLDFYHTSGDPSCHKCCEDPVCFLPVSGACCWCDDHSPSPEDPCDDIADGANCIDWITAEDCFSRYCDSVWHSGQACPGGTPDPVDCCAEPLPVGCCSGWLCDVETHGCVEDPAGEFGSEEKCEECCQFWSCDEETHECYQDNEGIYASEEECQEGTAENPPCWLYECTPCTDVHTPEECAVIPWVSCLPSEDGNYSTVDECQSGCWMWKCSGDAVTENTDCFQIESGIFETKEECQEGTEENPCWTWECNEDYDEIIDTRKCIQSSSGTYETEPLCLIAEEAGECTDCCDWDGCGQFFIGGEECNHEGDVCWTRDPGTYIWRFNELLDCEDEMTSVIRCNPEVDVETDPDDKWTIVSWTFPCADSFVIGEIIEPATCNNPPLWVWEADDVDDCLCCEPPCCNWNGIATVSLAGPSGLYLDPNSDVSRTGWGGDGTYTEINDGVRAPQGALAPEIYSSTDGDTIVFGVEDVPAIPATSTAVSIFLQTPQTEGSGTNLKWGTWKGFKPHSEKENPGPGGGWDQYKWDIVTDLSAGKTGIEFEIINGRNDAKIEAGCTTYCGEDDTAVVAAYIEVEYFCTEDDPKCPYCSFTQEVQFTPCSATDNCWEYEGEVDCGDNIDMIVHCDPSISILDANKWSLQKFERDCADPVTPSETGILSNPEECHKPPVFYGTWTDTKDCPCCFDNCCDWDGSAAITFLNGETPCFDVSYTLTKRSDHIWEFGSSGIGQEVVYGDLGGNDYYLRVSCDPDKDLSIWDDRLTKWTILDIDLPCAENFRAVGGTPPWIVPPTCDNPPEFHLTFDSMDGCIGSTCPDNDPDD